MRILLTTNQLTTGGAEQFVVRLANLLVARHHAVHVLAAPGELVSALHPAVDYQPLPLDARDPVRLTQATRTMRAMMERHGIEVVHANSYNTAMVAHVARRGRPIPLVISGHGAWRRWKKPFVGAVFAATGDMVVGCAEHVTMDLVRHGVTRDRARTIANGIPFDPLAVRPDRVAVREALGIPSGAPVIVALGRLVAQKAVHDLLTAVAPIRDRFPGLQVLIGGDGALRGALESQSKALGLDQTVRFLGVVKDVAPLLAAADVYALSSIDEGLPLAIIEAMAAGLPIVATDVGGVSEAVLDGITGYTVPARQPGVLTDRLLAVLGNPAHARRMGLEGRRRVSHRFTLGRMADDFEALYGSLTARTAPERREAARPLL